MKWTIFIILLFAHASKEAPDAISLFEDWTGRISEIEREITARLTASEGRRCDCSHFACGTPPDKELTECQKSDHNESLHCAFNHCGHMSLGLNQSYVITPPSAEAGSYVDEIKRDICLTQGLEGAFKTAREEETKKFVPWTYFGGSESGIYVGWPGKPREQVKPGTCRDYDPRVRPWWRRASWHPRNIVILVDLSDSMKENIQGTDEIKWTMTVNIITRFLETLSEEDAVQIVGFDMVPEVLTGPNVTMPATKEFVNRLSRRLRRIKPDKDTDVVDIGKAMERAVHLLYSNRDTEITKCENHILLFSDRRDCSHSISQDCASKQYVQENGPTASQPVNATIGVTQHIIKSQSEKSQRTKPVLFTYTLSPKANGMLSQLACRLNGIHVDLVHELRNGKLDPLQLMRGYFRRSALTIAEAFQNPTAAVSVFYKDDFGLGEMNTLAMPVFYQPRDTCPPIHYGVIGADMRMKEYEDLEISASSSNFDIVVSNWNRRIGECRTIDVDKCHLQVLREEEGQCVYRLKERGERGCYRFKDSIYYVEDDEFMVLDDAMQHCRDLNGRMIAPQDLEERRFLAGLIPPDGAWINVTSGRDNAMWTWPDGKRIEIAERRNIERTCDYPLPAGFYMDPRNFKDNFQCVQRITKLATVCQFNSDKEPEICRNSDGIVETKEITEDNFTDTIHTCGMEDCLLESTQFKDYIYMKETELLCNRRLDVSTSFSNISCCSDEDLIEKCDLTDFDYPMIDMSVEEKDDSSSGNVAVVAAVIAAVFFGVITATLCICCTRRQRPCFDKASNTHMPLGSSESVNRQLQMIRRNQEAIAGAIRSPFEVATPSAASIGKRPELVVNIEVKILENGWEKVGGYGRVRQGEYTDTTGNVHKVAVKFVDALAPNAAWEALKNEFDILASIPLHPNIVKPIGAHWGDRTENSQRYIVEELMHTNLGDLMRDTNPPPYPGKTMLYRDWIKIFVGIARGLEHLHQHKIIHFDLKPRNVLLDEDMNAKIADFGCSKSKFDTYIELSKMGGTPPYLAPECWMLYYAQNVRTEVARVKIDVYSFGVIMWECMNGGNSLASALYKRKSTASSQASANPDNIEIVRESRSSEGNQQWEIQYHLSEQIPEGLRNLVTQCVRVDFDSRPTCEKILSTLEPMLEEEWSNHPVP